MLAQLVHEEQIRRKTEENLANSIAKEHSDMVRQLHEEVRKHFADMENLELKGDYNRPIGLAQRQQGIEKILRPHGITIILGPSISPAELVLAVARLNGQKPAHYSLYVSRSYPYQSDQPAAIDQHTPIEEVIRQLFSALLPHLHMRLMEAD